MFAILIPTSPSGTQSLPELAVTTLQEVASTYALPLLLITLSLGACAFLLCTLRVTRPLPALTRGMLLLSLLLVLFSLAYAPALALAMLSWASVVALLIVDELMLLRNQRRQAAG